MRRACTLRPTEKINLMKVVKELKEEVTEKNRGLNELNSENSSLKSQVRSSWRCSGSRGTSPSSSR